MKEFIEKLIGRLEDELKTAREMQTTQCIEHDGYGTPLQSKLSGEICTLLKVQNIVKQLAEQYNNGWIPVEEEPPETDKYILLSFSNFSIPCVGRYEEDENGGAFYVGDDDETCVSQDLFVNAWMNLPDPYQTKGGNR